MSSILLVPLVYLEKNGSFSCTHFSLSYDCHVEDAVSQLSGLCHPQIQHEGCFEFELDEGYSISTAKLYTSRAFFG
jgi:hypothetical protein